MELKINSVGVISEGYATKNEFFIFPNQYRVICPKLLDSIVIGGAYDKERKSFFELLRNYPRNCTQMTYASPTSLFPYINQLNSE